MWSLRILKIGTFLLNASSIYIFNYKVLQIWNIKTTQESTYGRIFLRISSTFSTHCRNLLSTDKNYYIYENMENSINILKIYGNLLTFLKI